LHSDDFTPTHPSPLPALTKGTITTSSSRKDQKLQYVQCSQKYERTKKTIFNEEKLKKKTMMEGT
jgi:hypothetical protein